jgi:putative heme transporter
LASFARMQCRLLRAGARRARLLPVMATTYAGNALSATLPLVGSQMSTVFVFRRFKQLGADASVAGWPWSSPGWSPRWRQLSFSWSLPS